MNTPGVPDIFDGMDAPAPTPPIGIKTPPAAIAEHQARLAGIPFQLANGDVVVPANGPTEFVLSRLGSEADQDALIAELQLGQQANDLQARAKAAEALLPLLEQQAKLVPSLQAQLASEQTRAQALADALVTAQATGGQAKAEPATDDDGQPIPGAEILPVDPHYLEPDWFRTKVGPRLARFGQSIIALIGAAGVGKTKGLLEWAARTKTPLVYLNCKGSDPNEWFEYRSVQDGTTSWTPGVLTQVIQAGKKCMVIIDEPDTGAEDFKMRLANLLEYNPNQRSIVTPFGTFRCSPQIQWCLAMNGNGTNPSSRHRGTIPPALLNRFKWIRAPMVPVVDLAAILARTHPQMGPANRGDIAECCVRLMTAAERGEIDVDVSIRTAMKVADDLSLGDQLAWDGAVLDALDDPGMRAKACAILSDRFTVS